MFIYNYNKDINHYPKIRYRYLWKIGSERGGLTNQYTMKYL